MRLPLAEEKVSFFVCYLLLCGIVAGLSIAWASNAVSNVSMEVLATFFLNGILALCALFWATRLHAFSLAQFHWLFYLIFFFLAPLQQYCSGYWPWSLITSDSELLATNFMLFGWGASFQIGVAWCMARASKRNRGKPGKQKPMFLSDVRLAYLVVVSLVCVGYLILSTGFEGLFSRAAQDSDTATTLGLVNSVVMKAIPLYCFVLIFVRYIATKRGVFGLLVSVSLVLVACFPTGSARFMVAGVYLGLLLFVLEYLRCPKGYTSLLVVVGILVAFPVIDLFRYYSFEEALLRLASNPLGPLLNGFLSGNFDAYSMIIQVEHYASAFGHTNGNQAIGALLFFVPRAIWPGKPTITGPMVFESFNRPFTNVSTSIPAEAYIDFGMVGILAIGFLLGWACCRLDGKYWEACEDESVTFLRLYYPFLLPLFFFTMRGSLMAGFPYVVGFGVICTILMRLMQANTRSSSAEIIRLEHGRRRFRPSTIRKEGGCEVFE